MDYLNNFNTVKEYNDYVNGGDCPYINVSNIYETKEVKYLDDTTSIEQTPFTIEVLSIPQSASYITFWLPLNNNNWTYFKYRVYQNNDWGEWVIDAPESTTYDPVQFVVGDKIQIITDGNGLYDIGMWPDGQWDQQQHDTDNQLKISGNYMSVFVGYRYTECPYPEDYDGSSDALWFGSETPLRFTEWRSKESIVDASDLWLPKRYLSKMVYREFMKDFINLTAAPNININEAKQYEFLYTFTGCYNLTTAPTISVNKVTDNSAFDNMFNGCTSLTTLTLPEVEIDYSVVYSLGVVAPACSSLTTITNYANYGWAIWNNFNEAPQSGTLYYKDYGAEMTYNPADMVPAGWTCIALQENN